MRLPQALRDTAARLLGCPCEVTAVLAAGVARITSASGDELVIKQHSDRLRHDREVYAYRHWTAVLGSSAPSLIAVDNTAMIIITTAMPGRLPGPGDLTPPVYHQAGALLRRFHDAAPPSDLSWFRTWLQDRASHWTSRAAPLLSAADERIIGSHLEALRQADIPHGGPCHLDFQPRNWLIGDSGEVSLLDYEHARTDLPARDFVRLRFRIWTEHPHLRDAFLDGYGRQLSPAEDQLIWHLGAIDTLTALARGYENADPELTAAGRNTLRQLRDQP